MINFKPTIEQSQVQRVAHGFAEKYIRPVATQYDQHGKSPWELITKASSVGLLSYAIPESFGGSQMMEAITHALIMEELAWGCAGVATSFGLSLLASLPLQRIEDKEIAQRFCKLLVDKVASLIIMSPEDHLQIEPGRDDDYYIVDGTIHTALNVGNADLYVLVLPKTLTISQGQISVLMVEANRNRIRIGGMERTTGLRYCHQGEMIFESTKIPVKNIQVLREDNGFLLYKLRDYIYLTWSAIATGLTRAALEAAQEHLKNLNTDYDLRNAVVLLEASRILTWRIAWMIDEKVHEVSENKEMFNSFIFDVASKITLETIQIITGFGSVEDFIVEKWMRDARSLRTVTERLLAGLDI